MPTAVFDIDGTLTDTTAVDIECYEAAIEELLGIQIPQDWPNLEEVTDSAILASACRRQGRPELSADVEAEVAQRVGQLLEAALVAAPERFQPLPGAQTVFASFREAGWSVAMATGAWRPSAEVKLAGANISVNDIPLVTSSEFRARRDIIARAIRLASGESRTRVVYFGDGEWDCRAAQSLGCQFIAVGKESGRLRAVGAIATVDDFTDVGNILERLSAYEDEV